MIAFESVWKRYSKELFKPAPPAALQGVSFVLEERKTLGLIGANGAGKSTAIRIMMDFIRPDEGFVRILNRSPSDPDLRSQIGYLPETASFPANLTLPDLISFTASTCRIPRKMMNERSEILLDELGLWDARQKKLRNFSKGMQQRANFVLALLNDPQLLIFDEPMSGLDPLGRGLIINLIEKLKQKGKTILFCSHILGDIDRIADTLLVMHKGRVLFNGHPSNFILKENGQNIEEGYLSLIKRTEEAVHVQ